MLQTRFSWPGVVFLSCVFIAVMAKADAPPTWAQRDEDLRACRAHVYRFGERAPDAVVARVAERARVAPDDVEALFWAAQFRVDERLQGDGPFAGLRRAADKGHLPSMALQGVVLCGGAGRPATDVPGGVELIRRAAERGEPLALYHLANVYGSGLPGVPVDLERAEALASQAVDTGMLRGLGVLAKIYKARGDAARAKEFVLRAADAGDPEAIGVAVDVYLYGAKPDAEKAVHWLRRGALLGHAAFMRQYAAAMEMQIGGLARDRVLSRRLLERAVSLGDRAAEAELAYAQVTGGFGFEVDEARGLERLRELAAAGVSDAQVSLGGLLVTGRHVPRDEQAGIALLRAAAESGNKVAQRKLAEAGLWPARAGDGH